METYAERRGHRPDCLVRYRLYAPDEGGRDITFQHLRCDFLYEGDNPSTDGIYTIHPEFLDAHGAPLAEKVPVPLEGHATMWIIVPKMRGDVHRDRIDVGTRGYFMEGARKIGEMTVEAVIGLDENPT